MKYRVVQRNEHFFPEKREWQRFWFFWVSIPHPQHKVSQTISDAIHRIYTHKRAMESLRRWDKKIIVWEEGDEIPAPGT